MHDRFDATTSTLRRPGVHTPSRFDYLYAAMSQDPRSDMRAHPNPLPRSLVSSLLGVASLVGSLASPMRAEAALLREPITDLRLDLNVPGATVCIVVPRESQDPEACQDLNLQALETMANGEKDAPTGIAVVRFPTWFASVMVSAQPGISPRSAQQIERYATGVGEGAASEFNQVVVHGTMPGSRYDLETINGIHAIHFQIDLDGPKDPNATGAARLHYSALVGNAGLALVAVVIDNKHASEAVSLTRVLLSGASMPHPVLPRFGEREEERSGALTANLVMSAAGLLVLIVVPLLALRKSRKNKAEGAR